MGLTDRIVRGLTASLVGRVVYMLANAALLIALTRYLMAPATYGLLYLALSVLGVAKLFGSMGIPKAGARYVTEFAETDPGQVPYVLRRTLLFSGLLVTVAATVLVAVRGQVAGLLGEPDLTPLLLLGGGYLVLAMVASFPRMMFQAFNRVGYSALVRAIEGVGRLGFAVGFVLLGFGAVGALAGYLAAFVVAGVVGFLLLYVKFYRAYSATGSPDSDLSRRILGYSVPITITRGADVLDSKVDTILVGALLNPAAVAFYTLARQIAAFTTSPAMSLGYVLSPALGEQNAAEAEDVAARLYERSLAYVLLLYVPAAVGLALVARPLVRYVIGTQYMGAVPVLQVLCLFVVVFAVNTITSNSLDYLGRASVRARARGMTALANAGLNVLLIPVLGVVGAAIATVITYTTYTVANVYFIHETLGLRLRWLAARIGLIGVVAVGMASIVVVGRQYVTNLSTLAAVICSGLAAWLLLSIVSGLLEPREVVEKLS
jgi:O-antigen/teichoic acid export membrane protein